MAPHAGIGRYVLGKTIGEGTFGKVKLGTHVATGEPVAIKILERHKIQEWAAVERVARELHILRKFDHPHIIKLYEIIETPNALYLIMEYCPGGELFDHIVNCGHVPEKDACRFLHHILSGVEHVHGMSVVHRDLKPENLLLDESGNLKLADFGLSNFYEPGQLLKTACGSPCYASPEMISGKSYVPSRCDIWSLGVIVFALVCGHLPFEDNNTGGLYRKILNAEYVIPDTVSKGARDIIKSMLTIDPEKRITAAEIRKHAWYNQIPDSSLPNPGTGSRRQKLNKQIQGQLEELGIDLDDVRDSLRNCRHNASTTAYHLLLQKRSRNMQKAKEEAPAGKEAQKVKEAAAGKAQKAKEATAGKEAQAKEEATGKAPDCPSQEASARKGRSRRRRRQRQN